MRHETVAPADPDARQVTLDVLAASKTYPARNADRAPEPALHPISLSFVAGDPKVIAVVGQSGSGKSTLASLILGFEPPTTGEVRFDGAPIERLNGPGWSRFRRNVQAVFQDPYASFNPFYKVGRSIEFPLRRLAGEHDRRKARSMAEAACRQVGLDPDVVLTRFPHQLSGGQRQRLMVARALSLRPALLVADEPVSMVDASLRATILDNLQALHRSIDASILYITHDLTTAGRISHSIIVLKHGRVVEAGRARTVLSRPAHPYTRLLVESVPSPDAPGGWADFTTADAEQAHSEPADGDHDHELIGMGPGHAVARNSGATGPTVDLQSVL